MCQVTACKTSVSLLILNWIKSDFFYRVPELMLATLIQRYDKNHLIFDPVYERETN